MGPLGASTPNALIMEVYPQARQYFNPTLPPIAVKDGHATAPEAPGLGLEFDEQLIARYRVN